MPGLVIFSLFFSAILLIVVWFGASKPVLPATACLVALVLSLLIAPVAIFFQALATLGLLIVCAALGWRERGVRVAAVVAMVAVYAYFGRHAYLERQKLDALRTRFPIVSVTERLSYEPPPPDNVPFQAGGYHFDDDPKDDYLLFNQRRELEHLHERSVERFIGREGFGAGRMVGVHIRDLDIPAPISPIPLPEPSLFGNDGSSDALSAALAANEPNSPGPDFYKLSAIHEAGQKDFLNTKRFGYVKDRDHVVGFDPHQFSALPTVVPEWTLVRLELVSLLKFPKPRVYVSAHLPRMDELKSAPTRRLDDFESTSLEKLRIGDPLCFEQATNGIKMLGALRSREQCRQCHSVEKGALLGAFSYELRRTHPLPEPKTKKPVAPQT